MIKAIIFDVDGLMFNTEFLWVNSARKILKDMFNIEIEQDFFFDIIGSNINHIKKKFKKKFPKIFSIESNFELYKKTQEEYFINYVINNKDDNNFEFIKTRFDRIIKIFKRK